MSDKKSGWYGEKPRHSKASKKGKKKKRAKQFAQPEQLQRDPVAKWYVADDYAILKKWNHKKSDCYVEIRKSLDSGLWTAAFGVYKWTSRWGDGRPPYEKMPIQAFYILSEPSSKRTAEDMAIEWMKEHPKGVPVGEEGER